MVRHSDHGSQGSTLLSRHSKQLAVAGIEPSAGSQGGTYANALAETFNGLYKTELIRRRAPCKTREAVERAILESFSWFKDYRLPEPNAYIALAEAEADYYRHVARQAMPA